MEEMRIMLVDDEERFLSTTTKLLSKKGYDVLSASSGAEALEKLRIQSAHVVVLDVKMPQIGGLEVMREIKARSPKIQIILLTGRGSEKESELGLKEGAFAYILKPFEIEGLITKMKEAVGR